VNYRVKGLREGRREVGRCRRVRTERKGEEVRERKDGWQERVICREAKKDNEQKKVEGGRDPFIQIGPGFSFS